MVLAVGMDEEPLQSRTVRRNPAGGNLSVLSLGISEILSCTRQ